MIRTLLALALASPASAACLSPLQTVFACDIAGEDRRLEICAVHDDYFAEYFTYSFGRPGAEPELAFRSSDNWGTTKYGGFVGDVATFGIGLVHDSGYVYTLHATGRYSDGAVMRGILEVFRDLDAFHAETQPLTHRECDRATIEGDFRFFAP